MMDDDDSNNDRDDDDEYNDDDDDDFNQLSHPSLPLLSYQHNHSYRLCTYPPMI